MIVGLDWDSVLVDPGTQEWLPGAREALKTLRRRGHTLFVFSTRANWDGGRDQILAKLASAGIRDIEVHSKPRADLYIDDRAVEFTGDWSKTLFRIRSR